MSKGSYSLPSTYAAIAHPCGGCHTFDASHAAAENMLQAAYLTIGKLAPDYENVELSVGGSTVAAAVVEATGTTSMRFWRC